MATKDEEKVLKDIEANQKPALDDERIQEAIDLESTEKAVTLHSQQMLVNTTQSLKAPFKTNAQLAEETKRAVKKFGNEKTVKVSIPAVLQSKLGPNQFISINGVSVTVPVDGEDHAIPATHAAHLKEYLKNLK